MLEQEEALCELWDEGQIPAQTHSRLYHLEPIGVGSSLVESLTSYVIRLAEAHSIPPRVLVSYEIAPHLKQSYLGRSLDYRGRVDTQVLTLFWRESMTLNGLTSWAEDWVQALEHLTQRQDLSFLTMLSWRSVFSPFRLMRRTQAWCPVCYEEWREAGKVLYQPLLWALQSIHLCPQHDIPLLEQCPSEECKHKLPFLFSQIQVGYCPKCHRWLGGPLQRHESASPSSKEMEKQRHQQERQALGEMLAFAPSLTTPPQQEVFLLTTTTYIHEMTNGNGAEFARQSQLREGTLYDWIHVRKLPQHDRFLRMCVSLGVSPLDWLTGKTLEAIASKKLVPRKQLSVKKRRGKGRNVDAKSARSALEAALHSSEGFTSSAEQIASSLGCSPTFLITKFPKLYQALVEKRRNERRERKDERMQELRIALEATLRSEGPPPSLNQVEKSLKVRPRFLAKNFPELCQTISTKYLNELKRKRIERTQRLCEEVRQATLQVHAQGVYPSHRKVRALLKSSVAMKEPRAHATWRATLRELGWDHEHFPDSV